MANIPFSVAPALRGSPGGQAFTTPQMAKQAGHTKIYWELRIPSTTDYENPANRLTATLLVNGVGSDTTWFGGPKTNKAGDIDPPLAIEFDISAVPVGATLQVRVTVTAPAAFNIGIQNGLVS